MADEDEHIEVNLEEPKVEKTEADEPEVEIVEKVEGAPAAAAKPEISPEEGINELKKKFEREQRMRADAERQREEAERRAAQAQQRAHDADNATVESKYHLVVGAIEQVKSRSEMIRGAYASAMAAGDFDKAADLQQAMAENSAKLITLNEGERELRSFLENQAKQARAPVQPMPRSPKPIVEQLADAVSEASAAWLRAHKDDIVDERAVKRMFRAHEDAVDDGIAADTPEYFAFIEARLGLTAKNASEDPAPTAAPARAPATDGRRPSPPPAAPVSRGGSRPNVVRLTSAEAEAAKMMGMTEVEYAKNKVALQREGKMGN
jgi:hypothetical protein